MSTPFNDTLFRSMPIVGILRFFPRAQVEQLVPAVMAGGLINLEVTLNSPGAADLIRLTRDLLGDRGNVGAGTVTSMEGLKLALDAGASFIVTPVVLPEVIRACVDLGVPILPGAMTPTEIFTAWSLGATMVKVFPADQLGPNHLRAVKAPFPEIRLMPTGELSPEWSDALAQIGTLVPGPPSGDPSAMHSRARQEGAILVTSDPDHLARRWPSRCPSPVLVAADPAVAAVAAVARIQAHARDLRRGALLLGEELIDLLGVHASGDVEVDGVLFSWTGQLCVRDRPMVVVRVDNEEAPNGSTTLVVDAAGLSTTRRNGRPQIDGPALRRTIHAELEAGWQHDQPGEDRAAIRGG